MKEYIKFLSVYIQKKMNIVLISPIAVDRNHAMKKMRDWNVYELVRLEVIDYYTKSIKFKISWDKYEVEKLIYIDTSRGPEFFTQKVKNEVSKLISDTFVEDNRGNEIYQRYLNKTASIKAELDNIFKNIKITNIKA